MSLAHCKECGKDVPGNMKGVPYKHKCVDGVRRRNYIDVVSGHSGTVLCSTRQGMDLHAAQMKVENDLRIGHVSRVRVHGTDCPKATHIGGGYLHSVYDDRPYDVDGLIYCGRCHEYLS